jgi:hypothetical protein
VRRFGMASVRFESCMSESGQHRAILNPMVSKWPSFIGIGFIVVGIVSAANALVCGPRSFTHGRAAVAAGCFAGLALVLAGADILRKRPRESRRRPPGVDG